MSSNNSIPGAEVQLEKLVATMTAEQAIRDYLAVRKDPTTLGSDPAVAELQEGLDQAEDPVERLRLRDQLAARTDPERLEQAFIAHAKAWADDHGVGPDAFRQEGVPDAVLRKAGILDGQRRRRPRRGPRVSAADVRAAVPSRRSSFTLKALQEKTGASVATVRTTIADMVTRGEVEDLGTDPQHTGPGRAPKLYKKAAKR